MKKYFLILPFILFQFFTFFQLESATPAEKEMEAYLDALNEDITVAIMGCAVNGPQEASRADIGVAGGHKEALLFKKGVYVRSVPQEKIVEELKAEIQVMIKNKSH